MNILNGIRNFLEFINNNWTNIIVIIGLVIAIVNKVRNYLNKSDEEKIAIAKEQIREIMLKLVADAEADYTEWTESGSIKRSQVIKQIFEKYPILSKVADQEELVEWLDDVIDEALDTMKEAIKKQTETNE